MKHKALIGTIIGLLFTPLAVSWALKSAGHGDFYWAGVLFPLVTTAMFAGAGPVIVPLALLQYPFYGWYTGRCISKEHYLRLIIVLLLVQIIPMLVAMSI